MLRLFRVVATIAVLAAATSASAQFGHPLKGTWSGDWGAGPANRTHVVLEFNWDGKTITGSINPGPAAVPLKTTLDPSAWTVHMEGDGKDNVHYVIDGKIENLGSYARFMTGTWMQGSQKGTFKVTRN
jgi:hypothetical protein